MITKKSIKLFGVPGSGKTTQCLNYIKALIADGYSIKDICFTTFTTAGLRSIREKLLADGIDIEEVKDHYFKTIHSLTWDISCFDPSMIPSIKEKRDFFKNIGIGTNVRADGNSSEMVDVMSLFNRIGAMTGKRIIEFSKDAIKDILLPIFENADDPTLLQKYVIALVEYAAWLESVNKKEYIDALIHVYRNKIDIPCKILFVDEAQDLNFIQSEIIDLWTKTFDREIFIIAGDDDQAVYEFQGANPRYLIDYHSDLMEKKILSKSYRLPRNIAAFCNEVSKRLKYREEKIIEGLPHDGIIKYVHPGWNDFSTFFMDAFRENQLKGFKLLFRTNKMKREIAKVLFDETNIPFAYLAERDDFESFWSNKFMLSCNALNKIDGVEDLHIEEVKALLSIIPSKECLKHGAKKFFNEYVHSGVSVSEFLAWTKLWQPQRELFTPITSAINIKDQIISYLRYVRGDDIESIRKNEMYQNKFKRIKKCYSFEMERGLPKFKKRVELGTYHASKGLEAQIVIVFLATSYRFREINDEEIHCFYTASSRPKEQLWFIGSGGVNTGRGQHFLEDEFSDLIQEFVTND